MQLCRFHSSEGHPVWISICCDYYLPEGGIVAKKISYYSSVDSHIVCQF